MIARAGDIVKVAAAKFGVAERELRGPSRLPAIVRQRQIAMHVASMRGCSVTSIGRAINRDHSTALYADGKIRELRATDPAIEREVMDLHRFAWMLDKQPVDVVIERVRAEVEALRLRPTDPAPGLTREQTMRNAWMKQRCPAHMAGV